MSKYLIILATLQCGILGQALDIEEDPLGDVCSSATGNNSSVPDPNDCKKFFSCQSLGPGVWKAHHMDCPQATAFDTELKICNYKYLVQPCRPALEVCSEPGWVTFGTSCYLLSEGAMSWSEAEQFCTGKKGFLAELESSSEQSQIEGMLDGNANATTRNFWIGFKREENNFVWQHSGNQLESTSYEDWQTSEPNNAGGSEDCGEIHKTDSRQEWGWNDKECSGHDIHALCEAKLV